MNPAFLIRLGVLYLVVLAVGLLLLRSVNVDPGEASSAVRAGAVQAAIGLLLIAFPLLGRQIGGLLALSFYLLSAAFLVSGWAAVRRDAAVAELIRMALFATALMILVVHLLQTRRRKPSSA